MNYSEPTWGQPGREFLPTGDIFDEVPVSELAVHSLLIRYLQYCFISSTVIANDSLKGLVWTADKMTSKIYIGAGFADNVTQAGKRPAIFVNSGGAKDLSTEIDPDQLQVSFTGTFPEQPVRTSTQTGSLQIRVEGDRADETEVLAGEVRARLFEFCTLIKKDANLDSLFLSEVSPLQKVDTGKYVKLQTVSWGKTISYSYVEQEIW